MIGFACNVAMFVFDLVIACVIFFISYIGLGACVLILLCFLAIGYKPSYKPKIIVAGKPPIIVSKKTPVSVAHDWMHGNL